jgi:hypothetical protein
VKLGFPEIGSERMSEYEAMVAWAAVVTTTALVTTLLALLVGKVVRPFLQRNDAQDYLMRIVADIQDYFSAQTPENGQIIVNVRDIYNTTPWDMLWSDFRNGLHWLVNRGVIDIIKVSRNGPMQENPSPKYLKMPERLPDLGAGYICIPNELTSAEDPGLLVMWDSRSSNAWPWEFNWGGKTEQ